MSEAGFVIRVEENGCSPQISNLVALMKYSRNVTLKNISNLTLAELDYNVGEETNSIGVLLKHMAALESFYQVITLEGRDFNATEKAFWRGSIPGELYLKLIKGNPIEYYLQLLSSVRDKTYQELKKKDDQWLNGHTLYNFNYDVNNYYCWFHTIEDEISHLGQIKLIKKKLAELRSWTN